MFVKKLKMSRKVYPEMDRPNNIRCVWEHNGEDTLLYAIDYPGAYARGRSLQEAEKKMKKEISAFCAWADFLLPTCMEIEILQDASCDLQIRDADSDVLFDRERDPLTVDEYEVLKELALRSAGDFLMLFTAVPEKDRSARPFRTTFYGSVPRTAEEMYLHTKNVNAYYFGEIGVAANNDGSILECRRRGFDLLEHSGSYLKNPVTEGSYDELWSLRKVLRRFVWHDRIHAKAMYRMAVNLFGKERIPDIFHFGELI